MKTRRRIVVVTGSRADYGLLRPVMRAIEEDERLDLVVFVAGAHLLEPARTADEVAAAFQVAATVAMQRPGHAGRSADARALGRGVTAFADLFADARPDVVLVLGDRIEAFAAAAAAAVGGTHVAHMHGGDRAEGIADEGMRHAITKLAHVHLTATPASTERILAMGEEARRTHLVGSPAIDNLPSYPALGDDAFADLKRPEIVVLLHPGGASDSVERARAEMLVDLCRSAGRVLALDPNHDPGRDGVMAALASAESIERRSHLERHAFVGLLRRARLIVGNSSAALIEGAAIPIRCVNVGSRQAGREKPAHVIDCPEWDADAIREAITRAAAEPMPVFRHPYGDGRAAKRTCEILETVDSDNHPLAKRNTY